MIEENLTDINRVLNPYEEIYDIDFYEGKFLIGDYKGGIYFTDENFEKLYAFHISQPFNRLYFVNENEIFINF